MNEQLLTRAYADLQRADAERAAYLAEACRVEMNSERPLSPTEGRILRVLANGEMGAEALAERVRVHRSTVDHSIRGLVGRGLVSRVGESGARAVRLTRSGEARAARLASKLASKEKTRAAQVSGLPCFSRGEAVLLRSLAQGIARSRDIAARYGVGRATLTRATESLRRQGYLLVAGRGWGRRIGLTDSGRAAAERLGDEQ